jgi:hypothetical protein
MGSGDLLSRLTRLACSELSPWVLSCSAWHLYVPRRAGRLSCRMAIGVSIGPESAFVRFRGDRCAGIPKWALTDKLT